MTGLEMKYFVLKPRGAFEDPYAKASRAALKAYAEAILEENPQLYGDIEKWRITEQGKANETHLLAKLEAEDTDRSQGQ
jgi:hypothetical protein